MRHVFSPMNRPVLALIISVLALLVTTVAAPPSASAKVVVYKVTPTQTHGWKVSAKRVGDQVFFTLAELQNRKGTSATLDLKDGKKQVALWRLTPDKKVSPRVATTYKFSVRTAYLARSMFVLQWTHHKHPSGDRWEMKLGDFAKP